MPLYNQIQKLARENPELRMSLVPLLRKARKSENVEAVLKAEPENVEAEVLAQKLESSIQKLFPTSSLDVVIGSGINIKFRYQSRGLDFSGDPAFHVLWVGRGEISLGHPLPPRVRAELSIGGKVWDSKQSDFVKVGWRNKIGTPDQIVRHIENYFQKVRKILS